ncbi:ribonuclease R [Pelagibaculum spongiae]|uniref:Ribonuclease R n=1 Tax=Pelagibaculum spongiae TaxID=2080658 RepID=A0A2V1H457_9GAMM|nr:ribonuclease R [Pelagibaculum spongiae]PVZ70416.1 ribonuclease R [Pelagibaculum spongiae]
MTKKRKNNLKDPQAAREASHYSNPIASREMILELLEKQGALLNIDSVGELLEISGESPQEALRRRLRAMVRDGQLVCNRKGEYGLVTKMDLIKGRVHAHKEGFGFLIPEDTSDDLFLNTHQMSSLLHGDRVLARIEGLDSRGRREGAVVEILERGMVRLVGRYFEEHGVGYVVPDSNRIHKDVLIPPGQSNGAAKGQIVSVELIVPPTSRTNAMGKVIEVLGNHMQAGLETELAIRNHDLPHVFDDAVVAEADKFGAKVKPAQFKGREDIRHLPLVTIDGEDARDFDDAVFAERKKSGGWRLVVAIADVSSYVPVGGALDASAYERGNSVYFPGRVIPMLPEQLSNGLCSLNPDVDRLCMVCDMSISANGKLTRYKFYDAVMQSKARLTYTKVSKMLQHKDKELCQEYGEVLPHLQELYRMYHALIGQRMARGAIDFETTETRIVFDDNRRIEKIEPYERNDAHRIIEECMLSANVATARFLAKNKIPTLYRSHMGPKEGKIEDVRSFLSELGLGLGGGDKPEPQDYAQLIWAIKGRPDAPLIQTVLLRSLSQAVYSPKNDGHFGLAFNAYAHFTSPIRRYPDLLVHRAIRHLINGEKASTFEYSEKKMQDLGEHCSSTERRADEATREVTNWLKCEYMQDKIGMDFEGSVSGVTGFGLFVQLDDIYVDGLVHVTSLGNDYFHFDSAKHRMSGERTGKSYRLGDRLTVKVVKVSLDDKKIDFELSGEMAVEGRAPVKKKPRRKTFRKRK